MSKPLSVSIVIPAYNEESQLPACLDAIARQTVKPLEVIVVDNNSTDNTAAIARRYPFVTLLRETKQGPSYARTCGFNAARGDIIGRIDADSHIAPDWVETLQKIFANKSVRAVSGQPQYRHLGLAKTVEAIDLRVRLYASRNMNNLDEGFLYGSNMAIRKSVWQSVSDTVCHVRHMHEDVDLAAHLAGKDCGVIFEPRLKASVDWRQAAAGPKVFMQHIWASDSVFRAHKLKSLKYERRVALFISILYPAIYLLYKGYDRKKQRLSLAQLLSPTTIRISPVSKSL